VVSHGRYHVPDGRGRGAAADVPRHPAADRPTAHTAGAGMTGRWGQMRQSETAGVRLDERKAMGCNASVRSIGRSGRLWRTRCAIALAEEAQKRRPGSQIHPESGGVG
jgi:hypothetical protein